MHANVCDFLKEEIYDEMSGKFVSWESYDFTGISSVISGFPCKDFSRLNNNQSDNRGNVRELKGTSGSAFSGVKEFLRKWVLANSPEDPAQCRGDVFKGRVLTGMLENVQSIADPQNEECEEELPDDLETMDKVRSALMDCKKQLEDIGFIVIMYLMDPR